MIICTQGIPASLVCFKMSAMRVPRIVEEDQESIRYYTERTKNLSDLTADDIPPGLDPEDVALDCAPSPRSNIRRVAIAATR